MRKFDSHSGGHYPSKEEKTSKDLESVREKQARIAELDDSADKLDNFTWKLFDAWENISSGSRSKLTRLESMVKRSSAMKEEALELRFSLLTEEEREGMQKAVIDKKREWLELLQGPDYEDMTQRRVIDNELSDLLRNIPKNLHKELEPPPEKHDGKEYAEFLERFEETAHEAITHGISRIADSLSEIQEETGMLPEKILFADTSSRPLRYAVKPLLDKVYKQAGQDMPGEYFVKTNSKLTSDYDHRFVVGKLNLQIKRLSLRRGETSKKRNDALRELKRGGSLVDKDQVSISAQEFLNEINVLEGEISGLQDRVRSLNSYEYTDVFKERLDEIILDSSGPVFVIDDLVGTGRTIGVLDKAFSEMGVKDRVNYFAFIANIDDLVDHLPQIDPNKLSFGVGVSYNDEAEEKYGGRCGFIPERTGDDFSVHEEMDWSELQFQGFPFRSDKEAVTGVVKDQASVGKYVERSPERDFKKMDEERRKYKAWGMEAVASLGE
ncbi:hypothetical protein HQ524_03945 [Candidatus Uhrbacteria bacterium]|nr:hypothetical protein [Candidatus Uhrbacteria bacterium]